MNSVRHDMVVPLASVLHPGENCWRIEQASRATVIIDAADYFRAARSAMLAARHRIMLIGWDFDARIELVPGEDTPGMPSRLGDFILWLVRRRPELEIYVLRWDLGAFKALFRGTTLLTLLRWKAHPHITARLDGMHPPAASHHQKIVVLDDCLAFCGGIDMTSARWDTRAHRDDEPNRRTPGGTAEKPWHDATTALEGPVAAALGELARERWRLAGGAALEPVAQRTDCWPTDLPAQFRDIDIGIARTRPEMPECPPIHEIEQLYLDLIATARHCIYAESQYFASRRIAEAIARRLAEPHGPEIVLVNPLSAQGWLEPIAMDSARARLREALRKIDAHQRFRIYHPVTEGGEPIYVHAKVLIVDDRVLRIGSSNMNNRSMRLDTECDVVVDTALPANAGAGPAILAIRNGLLAEHLGREAEEVAQRIAETGSIIAAIEAMRCEGRTLQPYETPDLTAVEAWLADNEILDPEGPGEMFEPLERRGLFRRFSLLKKS
ncbi:phospholipase D-like domain-containing protein [Belnapia rosea]|uniref:phospholipase D-like domain-containing protein n=1 Tax=Belnapia rosea TaxID=938405 RepID=UPI000885CD95|nr:phospholipase D-like domain-containing protein [Belnapia rosea]SDB69638.1 Phosphatidylserine/phosphatidylglycerophosphate/cardiolipin synthase [Belnapia rosea]